MPLLHGKLNILRMDGKSRAKIIKVPHTIEIEKAFLFLGRYLVYYLNHDQLDSILITRAITRPCSSQQIYIECLNYDDEQLGTCTGKKIQKTRHKQKPCVFTNCITESNLNSRYPYKEFSTA